MKFKWFRKKKIEEEVCDRIEKLLNQREVYFTHIVLIHEIRKKLINQYVNSFNYLSHHKVTATELKNRLKHICSNDMKTYGDLVDYMEYLNRYDAWIALFDLLSKTIETEKRYFMQEKVNKEKIKKIDERIDTIAELSIKNGMLPSKVSDILKEGYHGGR